MQTKERGKKVREMIGKWLIITGALSHFSIFAMWVIAGKQGIPIPVPNDDFGLVSALLMSFGGLGFALLGFICTMPDHEPTD